MDFIKELEEFDWLITIIISLFIGLIGAGFTYYIFKKQNKENRNDLKRELLDDVTKILDQYKSNYISIKSNYNKLYEFSTEALNLENYAFKKFISHIGNISILTEKFSGFQSKLRNYSIHDLSVKLDKLAIICTEEISKMHGSVLEETDRIESKHSNHGLSDPVLKALEECFQSIESIYPK